MRTLALVGTVASLVLTLAAPAAADSHYAPLDRPGPELQVPPEALDDSLTCTGGLSGPDPAVLLVHGTNLDIESNFGWNYARQLAALGRGFCGVDLPVYGMNDIQLAAEYVVHAVRTVADRSGGPTQILGFSQGGMIPRWALRWWPDTRPLVEDVVGLAPSNHGTVDATATCGPAECYPSYWQQRLEAAFIAAVNSYTETFDEIDYTNVYTRYDEVVQPNLDDSGSSSLAGGDNVANVATQDVCPSNTADHLALGSYDPVGYALAIDALDHAGPADPERVPLDVCAQVLMPGVEQASFPQEYGAMLATIGEANEAADQVPEEPPLACYVTASCAPAPSERRDATGGGADGGATDDRGVPASTLPASGGGAAAVAVTLLVAALVVGRRRR